MARYSHERLPGGISPMAGKKKRIRIQKPLIKSRQEEALWEEVRKYAAMIPSEPEPNMGRVQEIKEALKEGNYPTREIIEEAAARLAMRFLKPE